MKRKLIRQMLNQWRGNVWMLVQLIIVSCAIFYIGTYLYCMIYNYLQPYGHQTDNTYQITLSEIPEGGVGYVENVDIPLRNEDIKTIVRRIKNMDEVEHAALSWNGEPYSLGYQGWLLYSISGADTVSIYGNVRDITPEYIDVFRIKSTDGTSSERMKEMLLDGMLLASKEVTSGDKRLDPVNERLKELTFFRNNDSDRQFKIGGIVESTKRFDFEETTPVIYQLFSDEKLSWDSPEISVRLKEGADGEQFMKTVREKSGTLLSSRNIYVQDIQPSESLKKPINKDYNKKIVELIVCMSFLLINVFLGLFGIFWFRTRQRTSEIAVRRSFGATSGSVFRRLISEGLLLLLGSIPFSVLIDWLLVTHQLTSDPYLNYYGVIAMYERFLIPVGATALLMAVMIVAGISYPAYKAMRIRPAEALKEE